MFFREKNSLLILILIALVISSGCINKGNEDGKVNSSFEEIPRKTEIFPENSSVKSIQDGHVQYRALNNSLLRLELLNKSSESYRVGYKGETYITKGLPSSFKYINESLYWVVKGKVIRQGKKVVNSSNIIDIGGELGYVNRTGDNNVLSLYEGSMQILPMKIDDRITEVRYYNGFYYNSLDEAFYNGEKVSDGYFTYNNGKAYLRTENPGYQINEGEVINKGNYYVLDPNTSYIDPDPKNPIYFKEYELEGYREIYRGDRRIEIVNHRNGVYVNEGFMINNDIVYVASQVDPNNFETKSYYIRTDEKYYGPYKEYPNILNTKNLSYIVKPVNQSQEYILTKQNNVNWIY